jgi:hypothetical protein
MTLARARGSDMEDLMEDLPHPPHSIRFRNGGAGGAGLPYGSRARGASGTSDPRKTAFLTLL